MPEAVASPEITNANAVEGWMANLPNIDPAQAAPPAEAPPKEPPKPEAKEPPKPAPEPDEKPPKSAKDWEAYKANKKAILEEKRALEGKAAALEAARTAADEKVKKLEADLETARKSAAPPADYEQIKKALEAEKTKSSELDKALRLVGTERHPEFKAKYDAPIEAAVARAKKIVGADKAEQVARLMQMPPSDWRDAQLEEALSDLSAVKSGQVTGLMAEIGRLQDAREAEVKQNADQWEQLQAQRALETQAADRARQEQTIRFVSDTVSAIKDGDELKGLLSDHDLEVVKGVAIAGCKDPADTVKTIARGIAFTALLKGWQADKAKIEALEKQVKDLEGAQPGGKGHPAHAPGAKTGEPEGPKRGENPMKVLSDWIPNAPWTGTGT